MTLRVLGHRFDVRGWYAGMFVLWLFACVPVLLIGTGMGGPLAILLWLALNAVLFAPVMLAPYGIRRIGAEAER